MPTQITVRQGYLTRFQGNLTRFNTPVTLPVFDKMQKYFEHQCILGVIIHDTEGHQNSG